MHDGLIKVLRGAGIEVITDNAEAQGALKAYNVQFQKIKNSLDKAERFILKGLQEKRWKDTFKIELPQKTQQMVKNAMGRDFDSHVITISGIRHGLKEHGVGGKKITERSIPIREEDAALIPYIMTAPDYVRKGSTKNNRESVRFYKTLKNGYVVVVEKEFDNSIDDLETINIWGELSDVSNAQGTLLRTSETPTIGTSDAAKIRKDAENAIENEGKIQEHRVWHGSGNEFDAFDHSHMGEGEGAQAYGWGTYVTEVEAIGRRYAEGQCGLGNDDSNRWASMRATHCDMRTLVESPNPVLLAPYEARFCSILLSPGHTRSSTCAPWGS